jgi:hypothetical protein
MTQSPGTCWAPWPATPPVVAGGPSVSSPWLIQNGHITVNGQREQYPGVNFDNWPIFGMVAFKGGAESGLDSDNCNLVLQHLNNCAALGFRSIRIHGIDCFHGGDVFGDAAPTGTLALDPNCQQALAYFIYQARTVRGFRLGLTLHYNRQLMPSDVPANAPPEFAELMANGNPPGSNCPAGGMWPWNAFSPALQALDAQYEEELLTYVSPYDNKPLGELLDFIVVRNEQLFGKTPPWPSTPGSASKLPVLNGMLYAAAVAWCAANGINVNQMTAITHAQFAASLDVQLSTTECARVRKLAPQALLVSNTAYGDLAYSGLPGCWVGDLNDLHCYGSFLPPAAPAQRTQFAAMLAGCYKAGMPQSVTEWSCPSMTPAQQFALYGQATNDAISQDGDMMYLYSYANSSIQGEGSPYWTPTEWDMRVNAPLMTGVQYWNEQFAAPRSANPQTVTVTRTNGLYGANAPGTQNYSQYGPTNDPAMAAVPAGTKVIAQ